MKHYCLLGGDAGILYRDRLDRDKEASPERALYQRPLYLKFSITRPGTANRSPFESRPGLGARKFLYNGFFYTRNICIPKIFV